MTTSADPFNPTARPPLRISDPGDLLAAIPAMLGFRPERSVVLVCLGGPTGTALGAVMRHDLIAPPGDSAIEPGLTAEMAAAIEQFAIVCARERATSVIAVVVDQDADCRDCHWCTGDGTAECAAMSRAPLHTAVVEAVARAVGKHGCALIGAHVTCEIATGSPWWSLLDDPRNGLVPDPDVSPVTTAHVLEGRQIRASRTELADLLTGDRARRREVARALPEVRAAQAERFGGQRTGRSFTARKKLEFVLFEVDNLASGEEPSARAFAALALALEHRIVRDAVMALAVGEKDLAAEALWLAMTRVLPHPERADAATLLGFSAYVRGDGPLAGIAFEAALTADPEHRLAWMLDSALQGGIRPEAMRELATCGFEQACTLGVPLPPARER
ncbi:DUF4192 domain-containing protein [Aldersonia kunmingensis]|uniref:DUF4192 domain-containing protein n=1 Tax=Aldersonia kunmingensis TaxID=408066 RepID=UPI00082EC4C7|nr:DUF4192 domain-containing protein [Aldersonia kunmingensis]